MDWTFFVFILRYSSRLLNYNVKMHSRKHGLIAQLKGNLKKFHPTTRICCFYFAILSPVAVT